MKRTITLLIAIIYCSMLSMSQKNDHVEYFKCSHKHHNHIKSVTNEEMNKYDIHFYFLDIEASNKSTSISGNTTIGATTKNESLEKFLIELHSGITVSNVFINDEEQEFTHSNDEIEVVLTNPIKANTNFTARVEYNRPSTLFTDGIYNNELFNGAFVTHTLSEPFYAKNWFACKQDLNDKADSVYVYVTIDNGLKVGSNGLLTNITEIDDNRVRYEWESHYPIAYYLISIAIANYREQVDYAKPSSLNGDSILIQNYFYDDSDFDYNVDAFSVTAEMIEVFSDLFTLYPFWKEKYGHSYAPIWGAMEHQTMTTTGYPNEYITAHEAGHQWFGNNVTCATWQDIWINEGFASYSEFLWFENKYSASIAYPHLYEAQYGARQAPNGSIYIPFDELSDGRIFSGALSYDKGACLVHMIRYEIDNDELFFGALKAFQIEFTDSVATGDDFKEFVSEYTGTDLTSMFEEWYYGEGYPNFESSWNHIDGVLTVNLKQTTTGSTPFFTNTIEVRIMHEDGPTFFKIKPTSANDTFTYNFDKEIVKIDIDYDSNILHGTNNVTSVPKNNLESAINVYPNPFSTVVSIDNCNANTTITVIDMIGKTLFNDFGRNSYQINTSKWKTGAYAIVLTGEKNKIIKKIIKE